MAEEYRGSSLYQYVKGRFGVPTTTIERRVTVGTAVTRLLDNNPRRIWWMAMNRSSSNGAIGFDQTLTFANGLLVGANGGMVSMDAETDGEGVGYAVYAINQTASGVWYVLEGITL